MPSAHDPRVARLARGVLLPGFTGDRVPDWLARATEDGLGGVCLFAQNVGVDVRSVTGELHGIRGDVLVASDEEGAEVTRLEAATGSSWPGHAALGRVDDLDTTRRVAAGIGRLCRRAGVDLALAPDVDVTSNPDNPVIGLRAFGTDPDLVARHTTAFVDGLQSAGVAACAKHFPGHGDTVTDSHLGLPVIEADLETMRRRDLPPFEAAVRAGVRAVMTAHVSFPVLDRAPATLSGTVLGMLRSDLGFDGVVVSDALDMRAISAGVGRGPGAVLALAAGVDLVCIGNPQHPHAYDDEAAFTEVLDAVVRAVGSGELALSRLEDAGARVADLAGWVARARHTPAAQRPDGLLAPDDDAELVRSVARQVLQSHGSPVVCGSSLHILDLRGAPNLAAGPRPSGVLTALSGRVADTRVTDVCAQAEPRLALERALTAAAGACLVVLVGSPHRDAERQWLLDVAVASRPDAVVVATGLPDDRDRLGERWVRTWGDSLPAGAAAADVLLG
ncbi:MAG: glycoside hydrolase family 3 [Actinomycetota bacterium]|nr:glycoside hydrolase family 3 [Actinomycetota bacterium]